VVSSQRNAQSILLHRLKKSYPSYINTPTLLIDVVSVMGRIHLSLGFHRSPLLIDYLIVAFIPEGLPIAVTLSLAKVAHTLSKHKVLCK
jgi:sodium/potassium-transporting ATPase subunit alpha